MFNGPSPAWIKRWRWHGNQPGWLAKHPRPPKPTRQEARRRKLATLKPRLKRALREPRRFLTALEWYLWEPRTRISLALGRPIPEALREKYFLELHSKAERLYDPGIYDGEIILFYGEGLYEDPTLGWEPHASKGIRSFGVPGEHEGNRQAMMEPAVGFVSERLQEYLDEIEQRGGAARMSLSPRLGQARPAHVGRLPGAPGAASAGVPDRGRSLLRSAQARPAQQRAWTDPAGLRDHRRRQGRHHQPVRRG